MKIKTLGLAILSAFTFSLAACNDNVSSSGNGDSSSPSSSSVTPSYVSPWGEKIYSAVYKQYGMDIPFATGSLGAKYGVTKDNYGDPMIFILCEYKDADAIEAGIEAYALSAVEQGYNVAKVDYGNGYPAYDCSIPFNNCMTLHIQCLYGGMDTDGDGEVEDYMGLFLTSEVTVDPYNWPTDLIEYVLGKDIVVPPITGEYVTYSSSELHDDDIGNYVSIVVYGLSADYVLTYKNSLEETGFTTEYVDDSEDDYYLAWMNDKYFIQLDSGNDGTRDYIDINIALGDVHDYFYI